MAIQRGEIYWMRFGRPVDKLDRRTGQPIIDPKTGEPETEVKKRPVVILSRNQLNNGNYVVVVPFTTVRVLERTQYPNCVLFLRGECGLDSDCVAKTDEIATVDKRHIDWKTNHIGRATPEKMKLLLRSVRWTLDDPDLSVNQ